MPQNKYTPPRSKFAPKLHYFHHFSSPLTVQAANVLANLGVEGDAALLVLDTKRLGRARNCGRVTRALIERAQLDLIRRSPMSSKMHRDSYEALVKDNLAWLEAQPRTLERDHIMMIVRQSVEHYYPPDGVRLCRFEPGHAAGYDWVNDAWIPIETKVTPA